MSNKRSRARRNINSISIKNSDGHRVEINVGNIPDDKWTDFSGTSSRGVEVHSVRAHIPTGMDNVILTKTGRIAPPFHMSIDEFEMMAGKKKTKMLLKNAGR